MKFINYFILASLILSSVTISAQKVDISPTEVDEQGYDYIKVMGYDTGGYFALMSNLTLQSSRDKVGFKHRKIKLAYFNKSLIKVWSKDLGALPENANLDAVTFINGKMLVLNTEYKADNNTVQVYYYRINSAGEIEENNSPITEFKLQKNDYDKCQILFSTTRHTIALALHEYRDDAQVIHFAVLSDELKHINSKTLIIPYSQKQYLNSGYAISEAGDLAVTGIQSDKLSSSKKKISYYIFTSGSTDTIFKTIKLAHEKNIKGVGIAFNDNSGKLIITGFHTDNRSTTGASVFYSNFDFENEKEPDLTSTPIDSRQNVKLAGERNSRSGIGLVNYPIERIVVRNDGGAVIISEGSYSTEYSYYDYFTQSYTRTIEYVFGNIVIISLNGEGAIDWSNVIQKTQVSVDDGGALSSFTHILNSEELISVFNTDISKKNVVVAVKLDKFGELNKPIRLAELDGMLISPRNGRQVSATEIVIPVYDRKKILMARINFE